MSIQIDNLLKDGDVYTFKNLGPEVFLSVDANKQAQGVPDYSGNVMWTVSIDKNNISTFNTTDSSGTPLYIGYDGSTVIGVGGDKPGKFLAWPITDITEKEYLRIETFDPRGMVLQANPDSGIVLAPIEPDPTSPSIYSQVWDFVDFRITCPSQTACFYCTDNSTMAPGKQLCVKEL